VTRPVCGWRDRDGEDLVDGVQLEVFDVPVSVPLLTRTATLQQRIATATEQTGSPTSNSFGSRCGGWGRRGRSWHQLRPRVSTRASLPSLHGTCRVRRRLRQRERCRGPDPGSVLSRRCSPAPHRGRSGRCAPREAWIVMQAQRRHREITGRASLACPGRHRRSAPPAVWRCHGVRTGRFRRIRRCLRAATIASR